MSQPQHVLVIDDDPDSLAGMSELMTLWGYDAVCAWKGTAALAAAGSQRPDLAILDLSLADAFNVIQQLKALGVTVIVFSGWKQAEVAARAAGADAFVLKPDLETLERVLARRRGPVAARRPIAAKKSG